MAAEPNPKMDELRDLAKRVALQTGVELWALELRGGGGQRRLRIFIDKREGVNLADCESYSRQISSMLDVENLIPGSYTLEVSSPGWERVLSGREHFARCQGQRVRLTLAQPLPNRQRHLTGILERADERGIQLSLPESGGVMELDYAGIARAQLAPLGEPPAINAPAAREGNEV